MATLSVLLFFLCLIFSLVFTPLFGRLALKVRAYKELKKSDQRSEHIPCLGGLSLFLPFLIFALILKFYYGYLNPELNGVLVGAIMIVILGVIDDFLELSPAPKFLGQTLAVITLLIFGVGTKIIAVGELGNILITCFWMYAMINAFNLLDIMDGLCCGITVIAAVTFLIISFLSQNLLAAIFCSILAGSGLGFLRYNLPPARIYLGDTGSMFCGFLLAAVAVIIDYAPLKREIALLTPILALGLPIFDLMFVVFIRIVRGRSVIRKSKDHFALRLLAGGFNKRRTLLLMYIFGLFFAVSALTINKVSNLQGIAVLGMIVLICAAAVKKIGAIQINE